MRLLSLYLQEGYQDLEIPESLYLQEGYQDLEIPESIFAGSRLIKILRSLSIYLQEGYYQDLENPKYIYAGGLSGS